MDMKVKAHLHVLVIVIRELVSLYPFNSLFISVQNQTEMVIREVEITNIKSEKSISPINNKRLMKNRIEIFQYIVNNFLMALFFFFIDHIKIDRGTPTIKTEES